MVLIFYQKGYNIFIAVYFVKTLRFCKYGRLYTTNCNGGIMTDKKQEKTSDDSNKSEMLRKDRLKRHLIRMREDIVKEAKAEIKKFKSGEKKQIVETVLDDGDLSFVDLSEDISLKQLSTHRETLIKIDEALRKLDENTYGLCEDCGDEISLERLKIIPFATHCKDCQEKKEIIDKIRQSEELA